MTMADQVCWLLDAFVHLHDEQGNRVPFLAQFSVSTQDLETSVIDIEFRSIAELLLHPFVVTDMDHPWSVSLLLGEALTQWLKEDDVSACRIFDMLESYGNGLKTSILQCVRVMRDCVVGKFPLDVSHLQCLSGHVHEWLSLQVRFLNVVGTSAPNQTGFAYVSSGILGKDPLNHSFWLFSGRLEAEFCASKVLAIQYLQTSIFLEPRDLACWLTLLNIYLQLGEFQKALALGRKAWVVHVQNPVVLGSVGLIYGKVGQTRTALHLLDRASHLDPSDPVVANNLSLMLFRSHRVAEADQCLKTYIDRYGGSPEILHNWEKIRKCNENCRPS